MNILLDILKQMVEAHPQSVFVNSLYQQYCNLGGLSKKQLEGLYAKAAKTPGIAAGKLATLEAIIKKKPTRERAAATRNIAVPEKDVETESLLLNILEKYPQHKRILFLRSKFDHNEPLTTSELDEVRKLGKLLLK